MASRKRANRKRDAQRSAAFHDANKCSICHSIRLPGTEGGDIQNNDSIFPVRSECCGQPFHDHCLSRWLALRNTCPLCRREHGREQRPEQPPEQRPEQPPEQQVVEIQLHDAFDIQPVVQVPFGWAAFMQRENPPRQQRAPQQNSRPG